MALKYGFCATMTLAFSVSASRSALQPLNEKRTGIRQMMQLCGLSSFEYWLGMIMADVLITLVPASLCCIIVLIFDEELMDRVYVVEFFVNFIGFLSTLNCLSYLFSHAFPNVTEAVMMRNLSLIYVLGLILGPLIVSLIVSFSFDDFESTWKDMMQIWFFVCPFYTFTVYTINLCVMNDKLLDFLTITIGKESTAIDLKITVAVYAYQIIVLMTLVILIDVCLSNRYKKSDKYAAGNAKRPALPHRPEVYPEVTEYEE